MADQNSGSEQNRGNGATANVEPVFQRGLQFHKSGQLKEAFNDYQEVLNHNPDHFGAVYLLGLLYQQTGQADPARTCLEKAVQLNPSHADSHANLGIVLQSLGRYPEAIASYDKALALDADNPQIHYNKGISLADLGDHEGAATSYQKSIQLKPAYASAHNNLGNAYHELGQLDQALASYRKVLALDAAHRNAHFNVASVLAKQMKLREAEASYLKALEIDPDYVEGINNLGNVYLASWRYEEAVAAFDRALALDPAAANIYVNKGNAYRGKCQTTEAIACFKKALSLDPGHAEAHSNLVFSMSYDTRSTPGEIRKEAENWNAAHAYKTPIEANIKTPLGDRPLRVGFVSADFNSHPVSDFLIQILPRLNSDGMSLYAYYNSHKSDAMTARLKPCFSQWRNVVAETDHQLAAQVQEDEIDLLFDLSGHTAENRLKMFSLKPAPVQVSWLGYGGTTGLRAMDYVLCDPHVIPERDEAYFTETPWRLPDVWICFAPPETEIEVNRLPALAAGHVTFGSFNSLAKVSDPTIACWSEVLRAIPESRLFLKAVQLGDESIRKDVLNRFQSCGIMADRLELKGRTATKAEHLADYHRVDIALDPFPYAGGTTSVEAFWMGVPVLAKRGDRFVSNMGVSLGHAAGLEDWIAETEQDYVEKARERASDLPALAALRARLRQQMTASPLCNADRFAREFEKACREMWRSAGGTSSGAK